MRFKFLLICLIIVGSFAVICEANVGEVRNALVVRVADYYYSGPRLSSEPSDKQITVKTEDDKTMCLRLKMKATFLNIPPLVPDELPVVGRRYNFRYHFVSPDSSENKSDKNNNPQESSTLEKDYKYGYKIFNSKISTPGNSDYIIDSFIESNFYITLP